MSCRQVLKVSFKTDKYPMCGLTNKVCRTIQIDEKLYFLAVFASTYVSDINNQNYFPMSKKSLVFCFFPVFILFT